MKIQYKKNKRGGTKGYTSLTNIASIGAPFSGATAKPQIWVGGRRTKRYRKKNRNTKRRRY
jgi:hypothetical protein